MSIRTILAGAAGAAALAVGLTAAPAFADLPQAGDDCSPRDSRETVELPDGSVLECQRPSDGGRVWTWVVVVDPTEEPTEEPSGEPTDDPTEDPSGEPTEEPTEDPTDGPSGEPTEEPTEDPGGEPTDDPTDPVPEEWAEFLALLDPAPEGVQPGRFCKNDHALLVYAWSDTSAVQCQYNPDSDRHHWVEVFSFDDLVVEEDPDETDPGDDESDDKPAPPEDKGEDSGKSDASDRSLPVTGSALAGLVVAAVTAAGAGGAALWATRKRKSSEDEDEAETA